jgi:hypothetical protein
LHWLAKETFAKGKFAINFDTLAPLRKIPVHKTPQLLSLGLSAIGRGFAGP